MTATILWVCATSSLLAAPRRAMWVWHSSELVRKGPAQERFFDFLSAPKGEPSHRISVIFLARAGIGDRSSYPVLHAFIEKAHRMSIRVDYLCGEAYYALPEKHKEGLEQLEYVLQYNRQAGPRRRFDGIQYDVEPYMLPKWPAQSVLSAYLDFLEKCRRRIDESEHKIRLGAAIPRWFDGPELHGLYKSVLGRVDYVAVMDYVSSSEQFVHDGANTVRYGSRMGKEVWLGAEASELPDEPTATFFKLGNSALEDAFQAAQAAFRRERGFAGVAVEHYDTYQALRP